MKTLSHGGVLEWLGRRSQVKDAHNNPELVAPLFHEQFYTPKPYVHIEGFVRYFVENVIGEGEMLVELHEWEPWDESRMFLLKLICPDFDETSSAGEGKGWVFPFEERAKAICLFSLFTSFEWQSYLYGDKDQSILFNWEGDILDAWTSSTARYTEIQNTANMCKLSPVEKTD